MQARLRETAGTTSANTVSLPSKVTIVTGDGSGVGKAATLALLGAGYRVDVSVVGQSPPYMASLPRQANVMFHFVMATKCRLPAGADFSWPVLAAGHIEQVNTGTGHRICPSHCKKRSSP